MPLTGSWLGMSLAVDEADAENHAFFGWCGKHELRLQRLVWACDANQSAVAELNAILVSSFAQLVLQRHAQLLALGYVVDTPLDGVSVFVQLIIELTLEVGVDMVAMWAETEHGIPVTHYFRLVRSSKYFILHAASGVTAAAIALYSFVRHPNFA